MPADAKPLFRLDALRAKMAGYQIPPAAICARPKLGHWASLLCSKAAEKMKETELLGDFMRDVFCDLLGYVGPASGLPIYSIKRESLVQVDGKVADAALGRFSLADGQAEFMVVLEGKGPRDPLDRPFGSRKRSAVEQALQYAVNLQVDWFLVTNLNEIRLYHKGHDLFTYERFETSKLAIEDVALRRFTYLLGAERVAPATGGTHLDALLKESHQVGRELTDGYYREYAKLRRQTFHELCVANPDIAPAELLVAAQKILDRILFIAFCEDRTLLPTNSITDAFKHRDEYNPRPIWDNFRSLFRWIDEGNPPRISKYNGGLFAKDTLVERLNVPDVVCKGFDKLAAYEYGKDADDPNAKIIDVEILGHIFEQSISDLEELHKQIAAPSAIVTGPTKDSPSKRKKEGAFYTPAFVTRYIVAETLQPILADRFETLRCQYEDEAKGAVKKLMADPRAYDLRELTNPQRKALADFWNAWLDNLATVRIVDPACGSGAFLLEAFDQLHAHYQQANARLTELVNQQLFADVDKQILQNNLFGMDLNTEAIEICRLSLWIKTAEKGKVLTSLDDNVKQGNSVVADPTPLEAWKKRFPAAFADGGFDVVIGNPPYIRHEWIAKDKPFLDQHYKTYDGAADLYVYFYEIGMKLLKTSGRLGFISSNSFVRAAYGEPLREFMVKRAALEQLIDLGDTQVFADAKDVYPVIVLMANREPKPGRLVKSFRFRRNENPGDISELVKNHSQTVSLDSLDVKGWRLENSSIFDIRKKMQDRSTPLGSLLGGKLFRGVVTGCNEAFVIDTATRDRLIAEHPNSAQLLRRFVRGQDLDRWSSQWAGEWIVFARRGVQIDQYPAIKRHLEQFRTQLEPRPAHWQGGEWQGRKPGSYKWHELQDPVEYWREFNKPKLMYPDIAKHGEFSLDIAGHVGANTTYFLPVEDYYLLGVLNSRSAWFAFSGISTPFGERAGEFRYRMFTQFVELLPIPNADDNLRGRVESAVRRLIEITTEQQSVRGAMLDWVQLEFGIEKPSQRLQDVVQLDADGLTAEVRRARGRKKPLTVADVKRLKTEHVATIAPMQTLAAEALVLERRVSDLVNAAYGLTPDEIKLMWDTAPPRMPLSAPPC